MLIPAIERTRGRISLESLAELHQQGRIQVWAATEDRRVRGLAVSEVTIYPTGRRVLRVFLAAGRGLHLVPDALGVLESYAREWGCAAVEVEGRAGWGRVLRGYREVWRAFEKELFDG